MLPRLALDGVGPYQLAYVVKLPGTVRGLCRHHGTLRADHGGHSPRLFTGESGQPRGLLPGGAPVFGNAARDDRLRLLRALVSQPRGARFAGPRDPLGHACRPRRRGLPAARKGIRPRQPLLVERDMFWPCFSIQATGPFFRRSCGRSADAGRRAGTARAMAALPGPDRTPRGRNRRPFGPGLYRDVGRGSLRSLLVLDIPLCGGSGGDALGGVRGGQFACFLPAGGE